LRPQPESAEREGVLVPLLKRIPAGKPRLADDCLEGCLIIDKEIVNRASFALQVKGDSMAEAGILDGDVVLMESREDEPPNSRVVAVLIQERETDATLKRFFREGDHIRLEPANKDYPFIVIIDAPDRALEAVIRARYKKSHPGRRLEIYSDVRPQIAGWATGLIRREIR
jgi:repressor LexA